MKIINKMILILLININIIDALYTPEFVKSLCTKINEIHPILIPLTSIVTATNLGFIEREFYKKKLL